MLLRRPDLVRADVLASFGDDEQKAVKAAILWAWNNRRVKEMTKRRAAELCGIQAPHFTNIVNGKKHLPPFKINAYEWYMGNRAVSLTIERFRMVRAEESALDLARAMVGVAA
jgi:hypothetical protein